MSDAAVERARILVQGAQYDTALAALRDDLASSAPSTEALLTAAAALNGLEQHRRALQLAKGVIAQEPGNSRAFTSAAAALIGLRDGHNATGYADEAVRLDPFSPYAHGLRVEAGLLIGELESGTRTEDSAVHLMRLASGDPGALTIVGNLHRARKRFSAAAKLYGLALQIDPTSYAAANNRVLVLLRRWRAVEAIRALAMLLRMNPRMETARFNTIMAAKQLCRIASLVVLISFYACIVFLGAAPAIARPITIIATYLSVLTYAVAFLRAAGPGVRRYLRDLPTIDPLLTLQLSMLAAVPPAMAALWVFAPESAHILTMVGALTLTIGFSAIGRHHGTWTEFVKARRR